MDIFKILFIFVLIFFLFEYFRHNLTKRLVKLAIIVILVLFGLMILSNYVDFGNMFSKDSTLTNTGAAIVEGAKNAIGGINFGDLFEKVGDFFGDLIDEVRG